jgi:hypothetical protein
VSLKRQASVSVEDAHIPMRRPVPARIALGSMQALHCSSHLDLEVRRWSYLLSEQRDKEESEASASAAWSYDTSAFW